MFIRCARSLSLSMPFLIYPPPRISAYLPICMHSMPTFQFLSSGCPTIPTLPLVTASACYAHNLILDTHTLPHTSTHTHIHKHTHTHTHVHIIQLSPTFSPRLSPLLSSFASTSCPHSSQITQPCVLPFLSDN